MINKDETPILGHIPERIFANATERLEKLRSAHGDYSNEELLMLLICEDTVRAERTEELLGDAYRDHLQDLQRLKTSFIDNQAAFINTLIDSAKKKGV